jgi:predicted Fe-Mo cluster-binding NifX family protein
MKIAVSATDSTMDSQVDTRFGRCNYYVFVDTESGDVEVQENEAATSDSGAGIQAAQFVVEQGADAVISGQLGPNAYQVLNAGDLKLYQASGMSVQEAVDALEAGTLTEMGDATGPAHMGMRPGTGKSRVGLDRQAVTPPVTEETGASTPPAATPADEDEEESSEGDELAALKREIGELRHAVASLLDQVDRLTQ